MNLSPFFSSRWLRVLLGVGAAGLLVAVAATGLARLVGGMVGGSPDDGPPVSVAPGIAVEVTVPPGSSARQIGSILAEAGVISSPGQFEAQVRDQEVASQLRAGTYQLETGMTVTEVLPILLRGPIADSYRVTIREGLRVAEIIQALSESSGLPGSEFEQALLGREVTTNLRQLPEGTLTLSDWEGLLFPDTYEFLRDSPASEILQVLADTMEERVASVDWTALQEDGLDAYQGAIIASLIEAEVRVPEERALVSSVIRNRLHQEMLLQIDASVLYGLGTRDPSLFDNESDSPYNLYRNPGLPPTPIGAPGRASLEAAAAPADTQFLFYVLISPEGEHAFAETFEEHEANVQRARDLGLLP
jgi:UPF0755 protein